MNRTEAKALLAAHLDQFRQRTYAELKALMGDVHVTEVAGPSGAEYQIELEVIWDGLREKTNIMVMGVIDDGRLPGSLTPVSDSFIVSPHGKSARREGRR
jgi:hypothetical protein